jgi:hypothetical protein
VAWNIETAKLENPCYMTLAEYMALYRYTYALYHEALEVDGGLLESVVMLLVISIVTLNK